MYENVLIPTDGSEGVHEAIREGVALADLAGATVHGLYVVDTRDYTTLPEAKWVMLRDELEARGEDALATVEREAESAGLAVRTETVRGVPHEAILAYVDENDVDLVVMGTHGRRGFDRFLLGSVTENVIRSASVPVHVVRIDE